jgi:hypothetical protein
VTYQIGKRKGYLEFTMRRPPDRRLAELLVEDPGLRPEDVQVILSPNGRDEWSFGMGLASYVKETDST